MAGTEKVTMAFVRFTLFVNKEYIFYNKRFLNAILITETEKMKNV